MEGLDNRACSCRVKEDCPLDGNCNQNNLIYKAEVIEEFGSGEPVAEYYGCTDNFKKRFRNHTKSLNHEKYRNETDLSKFVWSKRDQGIVTKIKWSVVRKAPIYKSGSVYCCLCMLEKIIIILAKGAKNRRSVLLNERIDVCNRCPHRIKAGVT